jgi:beta-xylosidase
VFKNNKYIDVQFDEIEVMNHPVHQDIYGVTLRQVWGSSSYNDTGWVFLLIDFTDEYEPCINVRTWQPEKYSDGRIIDRSEIFSLNDINL